MFKSSVVVFSRLSPGAELTQPLQAAFRSQMEQRALAKNGATGLLMHICIKYLVKTLHWLCCIFNCSSSPADRCMRQSGSIQNGFWWHRGDFTLIKWINVTRHRVTMRLCRGTILLPVQASKWVKESLCPLYILLRRFPKERKLFSSGAQLVERVVNW